MYAYKLHDVAKIMFLFLFELIILKKKKGPRICKEIHLYSVQVVYRLEM